MRETILRCHYCGNPAEAHLTETPGIMKCPEPPPLVSQEGAPNYEKMFRYLVHRLQVCLQPAGSPPPGGLMELAEWIIYEAARGVLPAHPPKERLSPDPTPKAPDRPSAGLDALEVLSYIVRREADRRPQPYSPEVRIARYGQMEGPDKWAVQAGSNVLNKQGGWEWEPQPSSRDDAYLERCRFDSAEAALEAFLKTESAEQGESSHE